MPRYDVLHVVSLTESQQDDFANAITRLHTESFKVPKLFMNVVYTDTSSLVAYTAGKKRNANHIIAHVRLGNRTREGLQELCNDIVAEWDRIVVQPHAAEGKDATKKWQLSSCMLLPLNLVGWEAGLEVPIAGQEAEFLKNNYADIQRRADEGEEVMIECIQEIKDRHLI